jgi:ATP-dependent Clp protease protease subunit
MTKIKDCHAEATEGRKSSTKMEDETNSVDNQTTYMIQADQNDNRIIYITGEINDQVATLVVARMLELNVNDPKGDILLLINSDGGEVDAAMSIHECMTKLIHCDVATVCIGRAHSCGQFLLLSGTKGKRFITENSFTLAHQVSAGTVGKLSEMEGQVAQIKIVEEILNRIYLERTKITKKQIGTIMSRDTYMNAQETLKWGIVDHIIKKSADLYTKIS